MIALKLILLPTDFSPNSQPATWMACQLAERFGAALHLLHVTDDVVARLPDFVMGIDLEPLREAWARKQESVETETLAKLSQLLDPEWKQGKQTTIATRTGKPFVEIVRYAQEHQTDLIVMGTHGRTGLSHAMLGGVAENVIRQAPCAVLTVRPTDHRFETVR